MGIGDELELDCERGAIAEFLPSIHPEITSRVVVAFNW